MYCLTVKNTKRPCILAQRYGLWPWSSFGSEMYSSGKKSLYFIFVERSSHNVVLTILFNVAYTRIIIINTKNVHISGRKYD